MEHATKRLLDSVWTLSFEFVGENNVKIISYGRENPIGYEKEKDLLRCQLVEKEGRIVTQVILEKCDQFGYWASDDKGKTYQVVNPDYIFSYHKKP